MQEPPQGYQNTGMREALEQAAALLERMIAHARGEAEFSDEAVARCVPAVLDMIYAALD